MTNIIINNTMTNIIINNELAGQIIQENDTWTAIINGDEYPCPTYDAAHATITEIYENTNQ